MVIWLIISHVIVQRTVLKRVMRFVKKEMPMPVTLSQEQNEFDVYLTRITHLFPHSIRMATINFTLNFKGTVGQNDNVKWKQ
jgi:hypothetical protein